MIWPDQCVFTIRTPHQFLDVSHITWCWIVRNLPLQKKRWFSQRPTMFCSRRIWRNYIHTVDGNQKSSQLADKYLPETNSSHLQIIANRPSQKETNIATIHFSGAMLVSGRVVNPIIYDGFYTSKRWLVQDFWTINSRTWNTKVSKVSFLFGRTPCMCYIRFW